MRKAVGRNIISQSWVTPPPPHQSPAYASYDTVVRLGLRVIPCFLDVLLQTGDASGAYDPGGQQVRPGGRTSGGQGPGPEPGSSIQLRISRDVRQGQGQCS